MQTAILNDKQNTTNRPSEINGSLTEKISKPYGENMEALSGLYESLMEKTCKPYNFYPDALSREIR
ncbi:hypothetical protein GS399_01280 [Pedobacter sp. HMF7647]|uniref:Uncharacterized protein n=1 Tax=Hufsiella arboris TaxID=2695275 RepID=A0A7K1Y654_9SPHI|nr:hypothetical protein [Hufsiella arboris]MXV49589.1 hypothetical protein [Hufsiella arboris]